MLEQWIVMGDDGRRRVDCDDCAGEISTGILVALCGRRIACLGWRNVVAGEDEETDGDVVADEGVAGEWSVEEGVSRTWHEDALGVLVADEVYGELWMTWVMLSATAGAVGGAHAAPSAYAGDEEAWLLNAVGSARGCSCAWRGP